MTRADNLSASFVAQRNHARARRRAMAPVPPSDVAPHMATLRTALRLAQVRQLTRAHHEAIHRALVELACAEDVQRRARL